MMFKSRYLGSTIVMLFGLFSFFLVPFLTSIIYPGPSLYCDAGGCFPAWVPIIIFGGLAYQARKRQKFFSGKKNINLSIEIFSILIVVLAILLIWPLTFDNEVFRTISIFSAIFVILSYLSLLFGTIDLHDSQG